MTCVSIELLEKDIVKLILEFLENRRLHISQVSLERETGLINGLFSSDALFLRQLILDGQWDVALDFVQPLAITPSFDLKGFTYFVTKYKFLELLCINAEPGPLQNNEFTIEEILDSLKLLESLVPSKAEFNELCLLLTLPKLQDHVIFRNWNPSNARIECFNAVYPLVNSFLPRGKKDTPCGYAADDRLVQLIVKGLLYERSVELCQDKAIRTQLTKEGNPVKFPTILGGHKLSSSDLSLLTWLEALPDDIFSLPFEQKALECRIAEYRKPQLGACWGEHILQTPIKPNQFPHAMVPSAKLKAAEKLSRSMIPQYEYGSSLSSSVCAGDLAKLLSEKGSVWNLPAELTRSLLVGARRNSANLSQSIAICGFQLATNTDAITNSDLICHQDKESLAAMTKSINRVFETPETLCSPGNNLTFLPVEEGSASKSSGSNGSIMHQSVHERLEEIRRRTLQELHSDVGAVITATPPALRRADSATSANIVRSVVSQPTQNLAPVAEAAFVDENEALSYEVFGKSPLLSEYQVQRRKQHNEDSITPPQSPSLNLAYSMLQKMSASQSCSEKKGVDSTSSKNLASVKAGRQEEKQNSLRFVGVSRLEDSQAVRAVAFHPKGKLYAVGTNSRQLHVCGYPDFAGQLRSDYVTKPADIFMTRSKQHKGSVYCVNFNPSGDLIATGSNDKTIRLTAFNETQRKFGTETELTMHDGTVRDLVFIQDASNLSSLLVSGGAGNCRVYVTDCATGTILRNLQGHTVVAIFPGGTKYYKEISQQALLQDKTVRFWDLRAQASVNTISPSQKTTSSPVTSICVDPSGKLLVSGHEDASVLLFDITGSRVVQVYKPHSSEVRSVRFSPGTYYLLSGSYDSKIVLTDLRGELTGPLNYLPIASHEDKVIAVRWHPTDFTFLSTSADKSVVLWGLPMP